MPSQPMQSSMLLRASAADQNGDEPQIHLQIHALAPDFELSAARSSSWGPKVNP